MYSLSSSTLNFLCSMGLGDHSESVLLFGFLCGTLPSCLKVAGGGGGGWVGGLSLTIRKVHCFVGDAGDIPNLAPLTPLRLYILCPFIANFDLFWVFTGILDIRLF